MYKLQKCAYKVTSSWGKTPNHSTAVRFGWCCTLKYCLSTSPAVCSSLWLVCFSTWSWENRWRWQRDLDTNHRERERERERVLLLVRECVCVWTFDFIICIFIWKCCTQLQYLGFCKTFNLNREQGWQVGSVVRVLDWMDIQRLRFRILSGAPKKLWDFPSPNGSADSLSVSPTPCVYVYTHAYERPCMHVKDPVVHVRVRWNMEHTKKDPACAFN